MINPQSSGNRGGRQIERSAGRSQIVMLAVLLALLTSVIGAGASLPLTYPPTGRRIANVMGFRGADWLERPERESEENLEGALDAIGLKPGMTVAEVGAGKQATCRCAWPSA